MSQMRVQFIHGLESSPQGRKARLFSRYFVTCTPAMNTADFAGCIRLQAEELGRFSPDLLVGSSFGGAVAVELLQRGVWAGPTLLLAPAALRYNLTARLPENAAVTIVHGRSDAVVDIEDSRKLARGGTPGLVRLLEVDDVHDLGGLVESGRLVEITREAYEWGRYRE